MRYEIKGNTVVFPHVEWLDLAATFDCGQCFRWRESGDGSFTGFIGSIPCRTWKEGDELNVCPLSGDDPEILAREAYRYFALDMDYNAINRKLARDPVMKEAIEYSGGIRVLDQPFFETLISFIISQNNNIPRIRKIIESLCEKYGDSKGGMHAFPTPRQLKDVSEEDFFRLRTGFRAKYIYDAVSKVLSGEIDPLAVERMGHDEAAAYLEKIKGVGPKVADCVLLFSCRKYDSLPKDVWINRRIRLLFREGLPECIRGYEGIAQQYIFQYARFNLEKGQ
ncbi:MAG: DNA-3-methyladenine glycosylase 2 family protein [Oscillospiraceae bacterium]|nr:DNA-3-methyladenine glycosylase 2 family protein [Oscillospiraceae bacterium]